MWIQWFGRIAWGFFDSDLPCSDSERLDVLQRLHQGHLAITKCREQAKQLVWWPDMTQMIAEIVWNWTTRRIHSNDVAEPLLPTEFLTRPWEHVGMQWLVLRQAVFVYLLLLHYYSRYIEGSLLAALRSCEVIEHMKSHFASHGIPELLTSDNWSQYASVEFRKFSCHQFSTVPTIQWARRACCSNDQIEQEEGGLSCDSILNLGC